jgi:hypothetical protein
MRIALRLLIPLVVGAAFLCLLLTAWVGEAVSDFGLAFLLGARTSRSRRTSHAVVNPRRS